MKKKNGYITIYYYFSFMEVTINKFLYCWYSDLFFWFSTNLWNLIVILDNGLLIKTYTRLVTFRCVCAVFTIFHQQLRCIFICYNNILLYCYEWKGYKYSVHLKLCFFPTGTRPSCKLLTWMVTHASDSSIFVSFVKLE